MFTAGAAMPGFGGVLGQKQFARAVQLRRELRTMTWLFTTIVGATVLIWNPSFLHLWVGSKNYAGPVVNLLIVLVISQTAFIRTDSYIIDAALRPRGRVVIGALTVIATLGLGILLTHLFGIVGLSRATGQFPGQPVPGLIPLPGRLAPLSRVLATAVQFPGVAHRGIPPQRLPPGEVPLGAVGHDLVPDVVLEGHGGRR